MGSEQVVALVRAALADVRVIYMFGSAARGDTRVDSDVDLAVLGTGPIDPRALWELRGELEVLLHKNVDLVDLGAASTVLRKEIVDGGIVLFEGDATLRASFEMTTLAAYARLNEERRAILDDVRARGRIHG